MSRSTPAWLQAIDRGIVHRGPDGEGRFADLVEIDGEGGPRRVSAALVHRRLSIIDHDTGAQPMVSERGRDDSEGLVAVVFNGCIYNHRELRAELEAAGHVFVSDHSDTEVLIHGYREWQGALIDRLEGMYAFAIWDRANAALALARDWFGEKPLYVRQGVGGNEDILAFSSNAGSLAKLDRSETWQPSLNQWTERYLQLGWNWTGQTVYAGAKAQTFEQSGAIRNLPPTIGRLLPDLVPRKLRDDHSQRDFEELLRQAVERRLEADVPLGCFLSGGVDSSLIARFAKDLKPDLRTFTVRMPDPRYDESKYAEDVAEQLGTDHATLDVEMDPAADLVHLVRTLGQPFGDSSILPTHWVSKAARQHVTVALSGDGGDELFIGYERYMAARRLYRHRRPLQWMPRRWLCSAHPKSLRHKIARLGEMARDLPTTGILAMESLFSQRQLREVLGRRPTQCAEHLPGFDPMQSLRMCDLQHYLPDDLMCKVDTASMAVALEVRAPFLDRDVVRAALSSPTWQLAPGGKRKGCCGPLRRATFRRMSWTGRRWDLRSRSVSGSARISAVWAPCFVND